VRRLGGAGPALFLTYRDLKEINVTAVLSDGSRIMGDEVPVEVLATSIENHAATLESLKSIADQRDKAIAQRDAARAEAAILREKIAEFLTDGLFAIAGAVCTPEAGYLVDGGLWGFLRDVKTLRKQHDAQQKKSS
jgi:hypothetical protein